MSAITYLFRNLTLNNSNYLTKGLPLCCTSVRFNKTKERKIFVEKPKAGVSRENYRKIIHYPEDNVYTVEPLKTTHLAGRDPVTGRVVVKALGGGVKHKYHWVKFIRDGPEEGPPKEEKVLEILKCAWRSAFLALVGSGDELYYILATVNMKPGDIIRTSRHLSRIPIRPNEGDCYPIGSIPVGTLINTLQLFENEDETLIHAAGAYGTIKRYLGGKVVVQVPARKKEILVSPKCIATVGRLSNPGFEDEHIGSPNRLRELGFRPRSGLWQRKTGRFGRKIRQPPPMSEPKRNAPEPNYIRHTLPHIRI